MGHLWEAQSPGGGASSQLLPVPKKREVVGPRRPRPRCPEGNLLPNLSCPNLLHGADVSGLCHWVLDDTSPSAVEYLPAQSKGQMESTGDLVPPVLESHHLEWTWLMWLTPPQTNRLVTFPYRRLRSGWPWRATRFSPCPASDKSSSE